MGEKDRMQRIEDMYNPFAVEARELVKQLKECTRNLTLEKARDYLFKAGLIDEKGEPTRPYAPQNSGED